MVKVKNFSKPVQIECNTWKPFKEVILYLFLICGKVYCLTPLMELDLEEMWTISDGLNEKILEDQYAVWKVDSIILFPIITTMIRTSAKIRGLRIMGTVTQPLEVTLGYSINRTLEFKYMVNIFIWLNRMSLILSKIIWLLSPVCNGLCKSCRFTNFCAKLISPY